MSEVLTAAYASFLLGGAALGAGMKANSEGAWYADFLIAGGTATLAIGIAFVGLYIALFH